MAFEIEWGKRAERTLSKFPKSIASRIAFKIDSIKSQPFRFLEHYEGEDIYKLRIGEYRALIDVNYTKKLLFVRIVGHRKNIYK